MKSIPYLRSRGFVLLDALIAMVIVAIGVIGVAKLNSQLLLSTGLAKARAAAIQCAEDKIEECRTLHQSSSPCAYTEGVTDTDCKGVNEQYTRKLIFKQNADGPDNIKVEVTWPGGDEVIVLNSFLVKSDLGAGAGIGSGVPPACVSSTIGDPMGAAHRPRKDESLPAIPSTAPGVDGTFVFTDSGKNYLVDASSEDGKILLIVGGGTAFSTISGDVYIAWGSKVSNKKESQITMEVVNNYIRVLGSAGSACVQYVIDGGSDLPNYPGDVSINYSYFKYRCYMGSGWYGNIGIVRFDGGDRVCIGDPKVLQSDVTPTSRRPRLSTTRMYRGYSCTNTADPSTCSTVGMGMYDDDYTPQSYGVSITGRQHHFLLTTINGNPDDGECTPKLSLPFPADNPFTSDPINRFSGNAGLQFCMTSTCPIPGGFITYLTNFVLTVNSSASTPPVVIVDGGVCSNSVTTTAPFVYNCQINWIGWAGDYWVGNLRFTSDGELPIAGTLSNPAVSAIDPEDGIVTAGLGCIDFSESASTCPINGIGCVYKCIDFTKVDKNVTAFDITVTAP